jgi:hypothetical protein
MSHFSIRGFANRTLQGNNSKTQLVCELKTAQHTMPTNAQKTKQMQTKSPAWAFDIYKNIASFLLKTVFKRLFQ